MTDPRPSPENVSPRNETKPTPLWVVIITGLVALLGAVVWGSVFLLWGEEIAQVVARWRGGV